MTQFLSILGHLLNYTFEKSIKFATYKYHKTTFVPVQFCILLFALRHSWVKPENFYCLLIILSLIHNENNETITFWTLWNNEMSISSCVEIIVWVALELIFHLCIRCRRTKVAARIEPYSLFPSHILVINRQVGVLVRARGCGAEWVHLIAAWPDFE